MGNRKTISDDICSMLKEEVVYVCPLGLSDNCIKFERIEKPFTNHHIDGDSSNSEYWNLIRICEPCHKNIGDRKEDGDLQRKIKLKKKNISLNYFGPLAIDVLKMAYQYNGTSAMPAMVIRLLEKEYLKISNSNIMSVGSLRHVTFQDYDITEKGKKLIENLIGTSNLPNYVFSL